MDINTNQLSALAANKAKRDAAIAPSPAETVIQPKVEQIPAPSIQPEAAKPAPEAVPQPAAPAPPKAEEPKNTPPPAPTPAPESEVQWDEGIIAPDETTKTETSKADFKKLGSAFNLEVKTEEEFVSVVNEKLSKLKELESSSLEGIPDQLKQAVEVAKKGGDWQTFANVAVADFEKADPIELFEAEYQRANLYRFKNPDGTINWEKFDEELDGINPGLKQLQGNQLKRDLVARQNQQKQSIIAQAVAQQEAFQKNLGDAVKDLSSLLPKDQYGISIEPKHSAYVYEGISNGSLIKKHLGNIDPSVLSKLDAKKLMKTIAIAEFGANISKFQFNQGKVAGQKGLLAETQNVQLGVSSTLPRPETENDTNITSAERLRRSYQTNQPKNSL